MVDSYLDSTITRSVFMQRVMIESVPQRKTIKVRFNDTEVIKYFKGTNIKVMFSRRNDHHIDVRLVDDK